MTLSSLWYHHQSSICPLSDLNPCCLVFEIRNQQPKTLITFQCSSRTRSDCYDTNFPLTRDLQRSVSQCQGCFFMTFSSFIKWQSWWWRRSQTRKSVQVKAVDDVWFEIRWPRWLFVRNDAVVNFSQETKMTIHWLTLGINHCLVMRLQVCPFSNIDMQCCQ